MPKQSKAGPKPVPKKSSPGKAGPVREDPESYYCTRCTRHFKLQKGNFPASQSPLWRENNGYIPVCRHCIQEMYEHYLDVLGDERRALRRMCMKFDMYWSEKAYEYTRKTNTTNSRVMSYISKVNLVMFAGKTFDDTLDEEYNNEIYDPFAVRRGLSDSDVADMAEKEAENGEEITPVVPEDVIEFWGGGFQPGFYLELEKRWKEWCGDIDRSVMDNSERTVIRQICMQDVTITRDAAMGKDTTKAINALNTLMTSANLKPVQKKDDPDTELENMPLGVGIQTWEFKRPLPKTPDDMCDKSGIVRYINTWYLGHACKMVGLKNSYSKMYEEAMEKLRVKRPEFDEEDDDTVLNDIFGESPSSSIGGD